MKHQAGIPRQKFPSPTLRPMLPIKVVGPEILFLPRKLRRGVGSVKCSMCPPPSTDGLQMAGVLERCFQGLSSSDYADYGPVMKGGKFGSVGAVTLEKGKLDLSQKQAKSSPEVRVSLY